MTATEGPSAPRNARKHPQDHRPKAAAKEATDGPFTFIHDGKTYTFEQSIESVVTPGWVRRHRSMNEADMTFTLLEEIAGDDALEAIDDMSWEEFGKLSDRLGKHLEPLFR
ncbi:MAG: hypothetical protein J2O47_02965 [Acidimicrobiaceae bacterium]|nr:hypothetical protein [Acidimicrobiaceae bacterium]